MIGSRIDLIDAPVIGLAQCQPAGSEAGVALARANQHAQRGGGAGRTDVGGRGPEVDIVRCGGLARRPGERCAAVDVGRLVGGTGSLGGVGPAHQLVGDAVEMYAVVVVVREELHLHVGVIGGVGIVEVMGPARVELDVQGVGEDAVVSPVAPERDRAGRAGRAQAR